MITASQDCMIPTPCKIERVYRETDDTFTFVLAPPEDQEFTFAPGQFNMVYAFGVGEVPLSISGDPSRKDILVHTLRNVGPVTHEICGQKKGQVLGIRGPFGKPFPLENQKGRDIMVIAGGIGLAPLRPIVHHLKNHREDYGHIAILYGSRTPHDLLFKTELKEWRRRLDMDVEITVDIADQIWHGNVGVVTKLIASSSFDPINRTAYLCGPEIMMKFTVAELRKHGMDTKNIYLSMERNMKCAVGFCGHCQYGPHFICKDGPVFSYDQIENLFTKREV